MFRKWLNKVKNISVVTILPLVDIAECVSHLRYSHLYKFNPGCGTFINTFFLYLNFMSVLTPSHWLVFKVLNVTFLRLITSILILSAMITGFQISCKYIYVREGMNPFLNIKIFQRTKSIETICYFVPWKRISTVRYKYTYIFKNANTIYFHFPVTTIT